MRTQNNIWGNIYGWIDRKKLNYKIEKKLQKVSFQMQGHHQIIWNLWIKSGYDRSSFIEQKYSKCYGR
ncbi:hypothetical protein ACH45_02975 [Ligilactobacillus animalis]|nr:hypothetical protein BFC98_01550 [Ligilactobacillus animalis]THE19981.1 hypothetical protein ACH44_08115 [Ligilactobacillus animalis]THE22161.1 hypothetical protein ACH45_02975 [Ligilactobacillus animalis]